MSFNGRGARPQSNAESYQVVVPGAEMLTTIRLFRLHKED
jgi:hypothetical protein